MNHRKKIKQLINRSKQKQQNNQKMTKFFASDRLLVSHTRESFITALVNIAVYNSISLQFFSTDTFRALCGEIAEKLQEMNDFLDQQKFENLVFF
jgi:hypothetical protein